MIKLIWSIICAKTLVDKDSNNVTLFEVLEQVTYTSKQVGLKEDGKIRMSAPLNYELVCLFSRDTTEKNDDADLKISLIDPDGKTIGNFNYTLKFEDGKKRLRVSIVFDKMPVTKSGTYTIPIMIKDVEKNDYKIIGQTQLDVVLA